MASRRPHSAVAMAIRVPTQPWPWPYASLYAPPHHTPPAASFFFFCYAGEETTLRILLQTRLPRLSRSVAARCPRPAPPRPAPPRSGLTCPLHPARAAASRAVLSLSLSQLHIADLVAAEAVRLCQQLRRSAAAASTSPARRALLRQGPRVQRRASPPQARDRRIAAFRPVTV